MSISTAMLRVPPILALSLAWSMVLSTASASRAAADDPGSTVLPAFLRREDALRIGRQRGLDLLLAEAAVQNAEGDLRIAGAIPNPTVALGYYASFFRPQDLFAGNQGWSVGLSDSNAIEDSLSGKRRLRIKVARAALQAAKLSRADAQRLIEAEIDGAYLQTVLNHELVTFAREVQALAKRSYELMRLRRQTGAVSPVEENKLLAAALEADQSADAAEQGLRVAKVNLAFWLGVRGLVPDFETEPNLPKFAVPVALVNATRDSLLRLAFERRPDLRSATAQRERAAAGIQLAKRLRVPDIGLNLSFIQQGSADGICFAGQVRDPSGECRDPTTSALVSPIAPVNPPTLQITLGFTLPILYQQQGEIKKAEADYRTQVLLRAKTEAQLVSEVETAFARFTTTRRLVERMNNQLLAAVKFVLEKTELEYRYGKVSLLEYLDARREYVSINVEYYQDLSDYWTAVVALERAVGVTFQ